MYGVGPAAATVFQLPELDFAPGRFGEDAVLDVGEGYAVDGPFAVAVFGSVDVSSVSVAWGLAMGGIYPLLPNLKVRSTLVLAGGRSRLARDSGTGPLLVVSDTELPTTKRMTRSVPS